MGKVRYVKFHPDEYITGVAAKLDAEQQGVYWMICALIMSNGGEIPNDPKHIGRLVCLGSSKTRRIINHLISIGKITENQSFLSQKRAVIEVETARNRTETAVKNGSQPKKNKDLDEAGALFSEKLTNNHEPITNNHEPINGFHFEDFYKDYPLKKSRKKAEAIYIKIINSGVNHEDLIKGLNNYLADIRINKTEKRFIKHPTTWLNQECWNDEYNSKPKRKRL